MSGIVTRFRLSVSQRGCNLAVVRGKVGLAAAQSGLLVGPGILSVLSGPGAILGGDPAVVDRLGPVLGGLIARRRCVAGLTLGGLAVGGVAVAGRTVEIAGGVVPRLGGAVTLLGVSVPEVCGEIPVMPVELDGSNRGVFALIKADRVLIRAAHAAVRRSVT